VPDFAIKSRPPRVPEDGYETFYTMDPYGNLTRQTPKSQKDYRDEYGHDVTRVDVSNIDYVRRSSGRAHAPEGVP
jgi:hypothetical protein